MLYIRGSALETTGENNLNTSKFLSKCYELAYRSSSAVAASCTVRLIEFPPVIAHNLGAGSKHSSSVKTVKGNYRGYLVCTNWIALSMLPSTGMYFPLKK